MVNLKDLVPLIKILLQSLFTTTESWNWTIKGLVDALKDKAIKGIDLKNKIVIPGLNDSHIHLIRGGLNFNLEVRWDGLGSLSQALDLLNKS